MGIVSNGNRIEWSPIRSVIIQVINAAKHKKFEILFG